jgi:hypothetical protein
VPFHLSEDHTDSFEYQKPIESEVQEIVNNSHSDYDDTPENDREGSDEDE